MNEASELAVGATSRSTVQPLDELMAAVDVLPLWKQSRNLNTATPRPAAKPWMWRWRDLQPIGERALTEVPISHGGDRRVLALANPGLDGAPFCSPTLWGGIQFLGAHETAPSHRHTASAIRFVIEGEGVFTTVDGDALDMEPGDLIITANWQWHDHTNTSASSMSWFDGLDLPAVVALDAVFFERFPDGPQQPVTSRNRSQTSPRAAPVLDTRPFTPRGRYPWEEVDATLEQLSRTSATGWLITEYTNPLTGGPALPTMGCEAHRIVAGRPEQTRRKVGSSVYVVFAGGGHVVIDGTRFQLSRGDCLVTPSWAAVTFHAAEELDLFAITDRPLLQALALFREDVRDGDQPITGDFGG